MGSCGVCVGVCVCVCGLCVCLCVWLCGVCVMVWGICVCVVCVVRVCRCVCGVCVRVLWVCVCACVFNIRCFIKIIFPLRPIFTNLERNFFCDLTLILDAVYRVMC